jgi:predicted amidohydrolase
MRAYLPRFFVSGVEENVVRMHEHIDRAGATDSTLIVFPEQFVTGYRAPADPGWLHDEFAAASGRHPQLTCIFGTITEDGRNRQWVYRGGQPLAHYDKVHLFYPNGEGELWQPGERYVAVRIGEAAELSGAVFGLSTCNDVRFPEQARALKLAHDIQVLIVPALWPWQRDHVWRALLQARAIENGVFVLGCCVAGVDNGLERFDGAGNYVFDPLGSQVYASNCIYDLDLRLLSKTTIDTRAQYRDVTQVDLQ